MATVADLVLSALNAQIKSLGIILSTENKAELFNANLLEREASYKRGYVGGVRIEENEKLWLSAYNNLVDVEKKLGLRKTQ